ncbi:MAG: CDP-glycerol glycerophosphotransferase family protein, partial [Vicinamibacterales bacterium]
MSAGVKEMVVRQIVRGVREVDRHLGRRSGRRRILVDAQTPVNFTMVARVCRAMETDPRLAFYFTASTEPGRMAAIYREASNIRTIHPKRAALVKFDAYVASDFMWAPLLRETARVQIFHGVGGKYGFDAPDRSMREWHRMFFVNERRLRNFVASGAIDADSPAIRLVGMPKVDCLVDGTFGRERVLSSLGLDPSRPTVLYAPTWSPASSLNAMGVELVRALGRMRLNLIVKLHDRSRDLRERFSGGVDWVARLQPVLVAGQGVIAPGHDISPYLVASDLMITDHSSAGFEFLLRDRPIVRIHRPELIERAFIHADYVSLLASASHSVENLPDVLAGVESGLANPDAKSDDRRRVASDLFYKPGGATARSIR